MLQTIRRGTGGFAVTHPLVAAIAVLACGAARALAQEDAPSGDAGTQADLAAAAQNPIAAMVSLPIQNNTFFRTGPDNDTANVVNIQPVVPFSLGDWNVIIRTIIPVIYLPSVTDSLPDLPSADTSGDDFGLGDINFSAYFSPVSKGSFTWGIGPSLTLRTATSGSSRHAEMERRAGGGCARDSTAVGGRRPRAPTLVVRRQQRS